MPVVSVIIPVKNGAATLSKCIDSIQRQKVQGEIEIIIIDSDSCDESVSIARSKRVEVISIPAETFNHGGTRNLGVKRASSDFIYFTVQDAELASDDVLGKMLAYFSNSNVMGVCGSQAVPHALHMNPVDWYMPVSKPGSLMLCFTTPAQFDCLAPEKKVEVCSWDDVNAMYRRDALLKLPFEDCVYGEDFLWCKAALRKGYTLIKDTALITWHYHFNKYSYRYKVRLVIGCLHYMELGYLPVLPPLIKSIMFYLAKMRKLSGISFAKKIYWLSHNLNIYLADWCAVIQLRKGIRAGGINAVKKIFYECTKQPIQGRLKNQHQ